MTVHWRAAVAYAGAVVPLAIDVEFVFANLIAGVAGIFVLQSNQHIRCEQVVSTRCEFIANEKWLGSGLKERREYSGSGGLILEYARPFLQTRLLV